MRAGRLQAQHIIMKYFIAFIAAAILAGSGYLWVTGALNEMLAHTGSATSLCNVTSSKVAIGNQLATTVLTAGSYQWAMIEQPVDATNTVSIAPGGTAVAGTGILLTPGTATSSV